MSVTGHTQGGAELFHRVLGDLRSALTHHRHPWVAHRTGQRETRRQHVVGDGVKVEEVHDCRQQVRLGAIGGTALSDHPGQHLIRVRVPHVADDHRPGTSPGFFAAVSDGGDIVLVDMSPTYDRPPTLSRTANDRGSPMCTG